MVLWLILGAFGLSVFLSAYGWEVRPSWPLQLVAAALMLAISFPLIFGGLGFITGAMALGQLVLAGRLFHQAHSRPHR